MNLKASISGKNNLLLFEEIYQSFFKNEYQIQQVSIDYKEYIESWSFTKELFEICKEIITIQFGKDTYLQLTLKDIVYFGIKDYDIRPSSIMSLIEDLTFELAVFGSLYPEWANPFKPYYSPGFSNFHLFHGWACAFKSDGHNRLVSRKWLDYGPWKTTYLEGDISFIEFHKLGINSEEAIEHAREGHQVMGISDRGGFIQSDYVYHYRDFGMYVPETQVLKVIVYGEDIPDRKLLDSAALLRLQGLGEKYPLLAIHYVFIEEEQAKEYLHKLWLYGLDCRTIKDGIEISLAENYHPKILKPSWVSE